jgi:hypothetical protein
MQDEEALGRRADVRGRAQRERQSAHEWLRLGVLQRCLLAIWDDLITKPLTYHGYIELSNRCVLKGGAQTSPRSLKACWGDGLIRAAFPNAKG